MSNLQQLKNKLAGELPEDGFLLEPRTIEARLEQLKQYAAMIPFSGYSDANWSEFWMAGTTAAELSEIYKNPELAKKTLPAQQAFLLALFTLLETPTTLLNTLPARHRSFYYRELLGFIPRNNQADAVVVSFSLQKDENPYFLPAGSLLDAGQDNAGNNLTYATDAPLLITQQQLKKLYWTRQEGDQWWLSKALDLDDNIALPESGIRLFSQTETEVKQNSERSLSSPLLTLQGEICVVINWQEHDNERVQPDVIYQADGKRLRFFDDSSKLNQTQLRLSTANMPFVKSDAALVLCYPAGQRVSRPESVDVEIENCHQLSYQAQGGHGHLNTFSYPFGLSPRAGDAFDITLPSELLQSGGELIIEPQWRDLPEQRFADWYAAYPTPPTDNGAFRVQLYLTTAQGRRPLGAPQALFTGEGVPQMSALRAVIPEDSAFFSSTGAILSVELTGADFLHSQWQQDPQGKKAPWTPQVNRINTRLRQPVSLSSIPATAAVEPSQCEIYLGFSTVSAEETLSVFWSLRAAESLDLSWQYFTKDGWASLDAVIQDGTAGLSVSNLWTVALPDDIEVGGLEGADQSCYWIKGMLSSATDEMLEQDFPKLQAIVANAMTATLNMSTPVDDSHFLQALPAETISQLATPVSAISEISQPRSSEGARVRETEQALQQRAATRIAHRQRAITWDNMRTMLMDHYPEILDIRIPHIDKLNHIPALENQNLMVLADGRYCDNDDPIRPQLSRGRLKQMEQWLRQYTSLWAMPTLLNPEYVDVTASYQVLFNEGIKPSYGHTQLVEQLNQAYMPWAYDLHLAATPGNKVDYYPLLATLQRSPLVQRVLSLELTCDKAGIIVNHSAIAADNQVLILHLDHADFTGVEHV